MPYSQRACRFCTKLFVPSQGNQYYCSPRCVQRNRDKKRMPAGVKSNGKVTQDADDTKENWLMEAKILEPQILASVIVEMICEHPERQEVWQLIEARRAS